MLLICIIIITRLYSDNYQARAINNLLMGLVVNRTMVTPNKNKKVPVAIVNTNSYNVWICQPLLATDIVEVETCLWDYQSMMSCDGDNIKVSFCPPPSPEVQAEIMLASVTDSGGNTKPNKVEQGKRSKFGPQPKFNKPDFGFKEELERLPFPVNIGEVDMSKVQQV